MYSLKLTKNSMNLAVLAVFFLGIASITHAQDQKAQGEKAPSAAVKPASDIAVVLSQYSISKGADGKEVRSPSVRIMPNETIEYQAVYTNTSKKTVPKVNATLPVPRGMVYTGAASPAVQEASLDGIVFAPVPLMRTETAADGSKKTVRVSLAEYVALRWALGELLAVTPKNEKTVKARMQLAANVK